MCADALFPPLCAALSIIGGAYHGVTCDRIVCFNDALRPRSQTMAHYHDHYQRHMAGLRPLLHDLPWTAATPSSSSSPSMGHPVGIDNNANDIRLHHSCYHLIPSPVATNDSIRLVAITDMYLSRATIETLTIPFPSSLSSSAAATGMATSSSLSSLKWSIDDTQWPAAPVQVHDALTVYLAASSSSSSWLLLLGGVIQDGNYRRSQPHVHVLDCTSQRWLPANTIPSMPYALINVNANVVCIDRNVYVFGTKEDDSHVQIVINLDDAHPTWRNLKVYLNHAYHTHSCAVCACMYIPIYY